MDDFDRVLDAWHAAQDAFVKGDPEPVKSLWSHREDVTVANPYGPPVLGWEQVVKVVEHAASVRRDGEVTGVDVIARQVATDFAYVLQIEHARSKVGAREDVTPYALRATMIFRREDGTWKVVHRHADPITAAQPAESVIVQQD